MYQNIQVGPKVVLFRQVSLFNTCIRIDKLVLRQLCVDRFTVQHMYQNIKVGPTVVLLRQVSLYNTCILIDKLVLRQFCLDRCHYATHVSEQIGWSQCGSVQLGFTVQHMYQNRQVGPQVVMFRQDSQYYTCILINKLVLRWLCLDRFHCTTHVSEQIGWSYGGSVQIGFTLQYMYQNRQGGPKVALFRQVSLYYTCILINKLVLRWLCLDRFHCTTPVSAQISLSLGGSVQIGFTMQHMCLNRQVGP